MQSFWSLNRRLVVIKVVLKCAQAAISNDIRLRRSMPFSKSRTSGSGRIVEVGAKSFVILEPKATTLSIMNGEKYTSVLVTCRV